MILSESSCWVLYLCWDSIYGAKIGGENEDIGTNSILFLIPNNLWLLGLKSSGKLWFQIEFLLCVFWAAHLFNPYH